MNNTIDIPSLYQDIRYNLDNSKKALMKTSILGDEESSSARSETDCLIILEVLESIAIDAKTLIEVHPTLDTLYEKNFGPYRDLFDREAIVETTLLEEYLFPVTSQYPILVDGEFNADVTKSYKDTFKAWADIRAEAHVKTQDLLKNNFDLKREEQNRQFARDGYVGSDVESKGCLSHTRPRCHKVELGALQSADEAVEFMEARGETSHGVAIHPQIAKLHASRRERSRDEEARLVR